MAGPALDRNDRVHARDRRHHHHGTPLLRLEPAARCGAHRWRIENNLHWVLDVAFGEDQCDVCVDKARNFAILRRIALNLLKRDTKTTVGLMNRRLKACISDCYRAEMLG